MHINSKSSAPVPASGLPLLRGLKVLAASCLLLPALVLALLLSILRRPQLPVIAVAGLVTVAGTLALSATSGILLGMLAGAVTGLTRR